MGLACGNECRKTDFSLEMMMKTTKQYLRVWVLTMIALALGASAGAARPTAATGPLDDRGVVSVRPAVSVDKLRVGASAKAAVQLVISSGYHINSRFPSDEFLVGTKLQLDKVAGLTVGSVNYPKGAVKKFSFSKSPLSIYEGTVNVIFPITATAGLKPGRVVLKGKVTYQACNDSQCLPPQTVSVEIPVEIVPATAPSAPAHPEIFGRKGR